MTLSDSALLPHRQLSPLGFVRALPTGLARARRRRSRRQRILKLWNVRGYIVPELEDESGKCENNDAPEEHYGGAPIYPVKLPCFTLYVRCCRIGTIFPLL